MKPGWKTVKLGEVTEINSGLWKGEEGALVEAKVYRASNFFGNGELSDDNLVTIPVEVKKLSKRTLQPGDILLEKSGGGPNQPVGRVGYFGKDEPLHSFSNFTSRIRVLPAVALDAKYLHKYLFWAHLKGDTAGMQNNSTNIRNLDLDKYRAIDIPLPPLAEQKRIVALLDEAFAGIDKVKANAEACLSDAESTFNSLIDAKIRECSDGAPVVALESLCEKNRVITYGVIKLGEPVTDGVFCLRCGNLKRLNIDFTGVRMIPRSLSEEYSRTVIKGGELLINVRGTLGGVCVAPATMSGWNVAREIAVIPISSAAALAAYLSFYVATTDSQSWLMGKRKGAAYVGINIEDVRRLPVHMPSSSVQFQVSSLLSEAQAYVTKLEEAYQCKLRELGDLRAAILSQAFSGNLDA